MSKPEIKAPPGFRYRLFLWGYSAFLWAAQPLVMRYFKKRAAADPRYSDHMAERRGESAAFPTDIWVHAVSIGEFTSAEPLIRQALAAGHRVLVTTATPAGRRAVLDRFDVSGAHLAVRYAPIDRSRFWRRFFALHSPKVGLIMEVEFWPVMIEEARNAGCALCLTNSQVPSKSFPRAARLARAFGHPVARAAAVYAKSDHIAARFKALGATPVQAIGETRFDIAAPDALVAAGKRLVSKRRVLTIASVVAGEEQVYLDLLHALSKDEEPPLVIWVPRAPEAFEAHDAMLQNAGFCVAKRSEAFADGLDATPDLDEIDVLLGDSLGEMFFYLAPADAVIVGGGFVEKGAHNVIEPLSLGKPVITGPHIWTIEFPAVEAEAAGVLKVVQPGDNLADAVRAAITNGATAAEAFHAQNTGASARILSAVTPTLEEQS